MNRLLATLALVGSVGLSLYGGSATASASAVSTASAAGSLSGSCEAPYIGSDNRVHVFCTGPGIADLHVQCAWAWWRDAQTNIIDNGRAELALGCGWSPITSYYAEIH
ncbi:hypothetical protein ACFFV7_29775 [Nonomuraea spiralis]|uniref:Secreted protein n=1 Tax=Nonomuraea spiralis TaxID=46182 RepID=A0ABV5IM07_9ACTN|nr:hypothetical protein [Nonomuraea spiralis]GGT25366.1 hypothetical protein GCM10010176_082390 [Nonomuraea spiralis]